MDVRNDMEVKQYAKMPDVKYIKSLKGIHKGERCFVIGNGPSLTVSDLDLIKDETSFACNMIYSMFDKTEWRPAYYMAVDQIILMEAVDKIKELKGFDKFISYRGRKYFGDEDSDLHYIVLYNKYQVRAEDTVSYVSEDVSKNFSWAASVIFNQMELAMYMGFNEIYLLGTDNNYPIQIDKYGKKVIDNTVKSHFDGGGSTEKNRHFIHVDAMNSNYEVFKKYAETHGIKIYNATRGGKLEVFERVRLEDIL